MEITYQSTLAEQLSRYNPRTWFFASIRGCCLLLLICYLLLIPVRFEFDIVATVIVACLGALTSLLGLGVFLLGLKNYRDLTISSGIPASIPVFSKVETTLCFTISGLTLLPFFRVLYRIEFESEDLDPLTLSVTGTGSIAQTRMYVPVTFPHRGNWRIKKCTWMIRDDFDLWYFRKSDEFEELHSVIPVAPTLGFDAQPPIISSCLRDGDAISDIQEPRGDYYDLKTYHPSDGMRKIVWKIFARSGELLSRHPEKTMTPEGKVLLIVCARSAHDGAARLAVNYCRQICDAGLECSSVTLGMAGHSPAKNPDDLEKLLVETAWRSNEHNEDNVDELLDTLTADAAGSNESIISQILIVGDFTTHSKGYDELLKVIGDKITSRALTPVYILAMPHPELSVSKQESRLSQFIGGLFFEKSSIEDGVPLPNIFLQTAASHRWEIYKVYE